MPSTGEQLTTTTNDNELPKTKLESKLKHLIETLLELSITVYDYQTESAGIVHQKVNDIVRLYSDLDTLKDSVDTLIPIEVIRYIEEGKNPDLFTKEFIERAASENQFTNGKINSVKDFKQILDAQIRESFPQQFAAYEEHINDVDVTGDD